MEYIIGLYINLLSFFSRDNLMLAFFNTQKHFKNKINVFIIKFVVLNIFLEKIMQNMSGVKIVVVFLINTGVFLYLYGTFKVAFIVLIWDVITAAFEFFSFAFADKVISITIQEIMTNAIYFTVFAITYNFILLLASIVFKHWVRKNLDPNYVTRNEWILLSLFPALNYSIIYVMLYDSLDSGSIEGETFFIAILLILSSIAFIYFVGEICKNSKNRQLILIKEKEEQSKKEYISAVKTAYETQRRLTHDYNREISTLKSILQLKDYEKLESYLNKLVGNTQRNRLVVFTYNTIIDAVLNQKYTEANNLGVTIDFSLDNLTGLSITDEDIVIILTNSIDNAISAATESIEKIVQVFISYEDDEFLCVIKNSIKEKVIIENNNVVSNNKDIYHGFGINNIRSVLYRYDSHMILESTDNRFILSLVINF